MAAVEDLYQEIILDHYRRPRHKAPTLDGGQVCVHHTNPLCGDELDLRIRVDAGTIDDLAYDGEGCSISLASASAMSDAVIGRDLTEALALVERFRSLMHGEPAEPEGELGDAVAFRGVAQFPVRVKCALLAWMALRDAIESYRSGTGEHTVAHDTA